jgi:hypothetical protein
MEFSRDGIFARRVGNIPNSDEKKGATVVALFLQMSGRRDRRAAVLGGVFLAEGIRFEVQRMRGGKEYGTSQLGNK